MPRDSLCAHRKRRCYITHTEFALEQPFNDCAARGIGERREDSAELRLLCRQCEFRSSIQRILNIEDWLAERDEFELPVPICEQSDDSIRLSLCETNDLFLSRVRQ